MTSAPSSTAVTTTRADLLAYVAAAVALGTVAGAVHDPGTGLGRVAASLPGPATGAIVWAIARASGTRFRLPKVMFWTSVAFVAIAILISYIRWQVSSGW